jgi:putative endonuclease
MSGAYLYILRCADRSYYVGTSRKDLEARVAEHNSGLFNGYTSGRRPVDLVFAQHFEVIADAVTAERQVKGWSRAKKEALIAGDWSRLPGLAQRRGLHPSRRRFAPPQDEV